MAEDRTPLHARLYRYKLTAAELAVLKAMVEHCWDGTTLWASVPRIAAYSKLDEKTVQRVIHGYVEKRKKKGEMAEIKHIGLVDRGILTLRARAVPGKRKSNTYQLNEACLELDPRMKPYVAEELQAEFPDMDLPPVHGKPIRPRQKQLPGMRQPARPRQQNFHLGISTTPVTVSPAMGDNLSPQYPPHPRHRVASPPSPCRQSPVTVSPNSLLKPSVTDSVDADTGLSSLGVCINPNHPPTSSFSSGDVEKLKTGLREILPSLDDKAIQQIWLSCKSSVPDCSVQEVLHFAWEKRPALYADSTRNPAGLLISALPIAVSPAAIDNLRQQRRQAEESRLREEQRRAAERTELERFLQEERERPARIKAALAAMSPAEREQAEANIRRHCELAYGGIVLKDAIDQMVSLLLGKHALGEPYELPQPNIKQSSPTKWWRELN